MNFDTLERWLDWQQTVNPAKIDLRLERVERVAARLQLPEPALRLTVGGTNGKGSTVAFLESLLADGRRRIGTFTSPHLIRYNERIRVDGTPATDETIIAAFRRIEEARDGIELTYFEFGTLAAAVVFVESGVDTVLLEVGLGGRLDATNAFEPHGVVIASIALDHQRWLGTTREAIGTEKAGIMRSDRPAIFAGDDMPDSIAARAAAIGADLRVAGRDYRAEIGAGTWRFESPTRVFAELPLPALRGAHQVANAAGAIALLDSLGIADALEPASVARALTAATAGARLQRIGQSPEWLIDVAHNPHAMQALAVALASVPVSGKTRAVLGMLADKAVGEAVAELAGAVDEWAAVDLDSARALSGRELAAIVANETGKPCEIFADIGHALEAQAAEAGPDDRILVAGSFHLAGPALRHLGL